jgi:enoyl-CoA hydratase
LIDNFSKQAEKTMSDRYAKFTKFEFDYPAERVLRITFNNPKTYNSLDAVGHKEFTYLWREIDDDPDINAVILTGKGKAFSSGGDFSMIEANMNDEYARLQAWKEARDLVYNIINCNKPIVSAINGVAVGAGLVAALLADISIAGKAATIIDGHTRLGVAAGDCAVINWPLLCGMAKAKYLLLLCEPVNGELADELGLVSLCVEDDELQDKAIEIATRLAKGPPNAIRWTKYALNNWYRMMGPSYDASTALEMLGFAGSEVREGLAALREKREPVFDPRSPV